ncbi:uncharacterized protein [Lolium perenne]|uniref:uncharacterized protein n=1 Tax=Lolium perenne TaxID=4522 RepID=UPI0021F58292|nr:uncharacterized protein LOC127292289 [Lolium perenne]
MEDIRDMELLLRRATLFAGGTASLAIDVAKAALPVSATQMAHMAYELGSAADNNGVNNVELLKAAEEVRRADDKTRCEAVSGLIHACVELARDAVHAGHDGIMHNAIDLALAGRFFLRVAALGSTERPATSQPEHRLMEQPATGQPMQKPQEQLATGQPMQKPQEQPATIQPMQKPQEQPAGAGHAAWWSKWKRKTEVSDLEKHLLQKSPPPSGNVAVASSSSLDKVQGKLCDKWLGMQVSALSMSLCLLPYMGRDGLLKEGTFSARYLWWVDVLFKLWWGVVALGVPCSLYGSWWIELQYARLSGHLGILGLTVLVGMFSHWILATEVTAVLIIFLVFTTGFFYQFLYQVLCHGSAVMLLQ